MKSKILHKLIQEGLRANQIIINAKDISHRSRQRYVKEGWLEQQSDHHFILTQKGFDDNQDDNQLGGEINEEHI